MCMPAPWPIQIDHTRPGAQSGFCWRRFSYFIVMNMEQQHDCWHTKVERRQVPDSKVWSRHICLKSQKKPNSSNQYLFNKQCHYSFIWQNLLGIRCQILCHTLGYKLEYDSTPAFTVAIVQWRTWQINKQQCRGKCKVHRLSSIPRPTDPWRVALFYNTCKRGGLSYIFLGNVSALDICSPSLTLRLVTSQTLGSWLPGILCLGCCSAWTVGEWGAGQVCSDTASPTLPLHKVIHTQLMSLKGHIRTPGRLPAAHFSKSKSFHSKFQ